MTHWIIRIGDGENFWRSQPFMTWGIESRNVTQTRFIQSAVAGDVLWFVTNRSRGRAVAVAVFHSVVERQTNDIVSGTLPDALLRWSGNGEWTHEVRYEHLIDLRTCDVFTEIKGQVTIRKFDHDKCAINLVNEYNNILRYINARLIPY